MKRTFLIIVLGVLAFVGFKGWKYYAENALYANYIVECFLHGLDLDVDNGYTDKVSYLPGEEQKVYIDAKKAQEKYVKLYNIKNEVVDSLWVEIAPQDHGPNPAENGFGYSATFTYKVPLLKSGLYLWEESIPFIIKSRKKEEIVVLYPTNTINAYNISGGKSLYSLFSRQTHIVSFQRPTFPAVSFQVKSGLEYFSKRSNLPLQFIADQDMEDYSSIAHARLLIVIGHNEYWTRRAREHFDQFVDTGGNVLILSGNTMWWQIRYENDGERMVCYKELPDPVDDPLLTTTFWTNEILEYPIIPSIGADFPHGGFGRKTEVSNQGFKVTDATSPIFKGTHLQNGDLISIPTKEYDGALLKFNGNQPELDLDKLNFYRAALLAYDDAYLEHSGNGAFIIFQKSRTSGTVINTGTMDWCSGYGLGGEDAAVVEKITDNMIAGLLKDVDLFPPR